MSIKTIIVDDHPLISAGLKGILDSDSRFQCVAIFDQLDAASQFLTLNSVDLVISDLQFPEGIAIPFISQVSSRKTRVVVSSGHRVDLFRPLCLAAGAYEYIAKTTDPAEVLTILHAVANHDVVAYVPESRSRLQFADSSSIRLLTVREWEVLALIGRGCSTREIAEKLFVSAKTIESHRSTIKRKLSIESKDKLISVAAQWLSMSTSA